jgi:hypothetical protein
MHRQIRHCFGCPETLGVFSEYCELETVLDMLTVSSETSVDESRGEGRTGKHTSERDPLRLRSTSAAGHQLRDTPSEGNPDSTSSRVEGLLYLCLPLPR